MIVLVVILQISCVRREIFTKKIPNEDVFTTPSGDKNFFVKNKLLKISIFYSIVKKIYYCYNIVEIIKNIC